MDVRKLVPVVGFFLFPFLLAAQTAEVGDEPLQRGFSAMVLGQTLAEAKRVLPTDPYFVYRGDPDVSFLPLQEIPLITVAGRTFVSRGLFQFTDEALSVITLELDQARLDYFSVFQSLVAQYGEPFDLDPTRAYWEDELTRISLERPLVVKYIDRPTLDARAEAGRTQEALDAVSRDRFLEEL